MAGTEGSTIASTGLASALFGRTQQRVLGLLFAQPDRGFQSAEIIRLAETGTGSVHRFLQRLVAVGLVDVQRIGNQKYYRANRESPIFRELHGLVIKTVGVVEPLRRALAPLAERIRAAFVFGSIAKGSERAKSDLDLMVITDLLGYPDLYSVLQDVEERLQRQVSPTVLTGDEWRREREETDSFVARIASQPKLFVIGDENDLA